LSGWYWCILFYFCKVDGYWCFVAADKDIIDYLKYNLRSQMLPKLYQWFKLLVLLKRLSCCVITQN
jgi:hypothetical protein